MTDHPAERSLQAAEQIPLLQHESLAGFAAGAGFS